MSTHSARVTEEALSGFDLSLYHWNLLTDEIRWSGTESALMAATGFAKIRRGIEFANMRDDGEERDHWVMSAKAGETLKSVFAIPTGMAKVTWIEDEAKRWDLNGVPHISGMLRRVATPKLKRDKIFHAAGERANRQMLNDHLRKSRQDLDRNFAFFGIDNLRDLNRALGPDATDDIIGEVQGRLTAAVPHLAQFARITSAKFGLAEVGSEPHHLTTSVRTMMEAVGRTEIETALGPVAVTVSAGIATAPAGETLSADPLADAQKAYDEGRLGRVESLRFARPDASGASLRAQRLAGARLVMDAIAQDRIRVAYQPIVHAKHLSTCAFYECLVRIIDHDGSLVPAGEFMPAIERLGLVRQVDREMLRRATDTLRMKPDLRLSVNLSPQSMNDSEWLAILTSAAEQDDSVPDRLIIEVTESSAILDPARTLAFMNRVRKLGCSFALDDFGAGYTSFKHFRDFRFDAVKIDGGFIKGIARNTDNQLLARTLTSIASHFGMFTVAEFVEEEEDENFLQTLGIDMFQGFRYGKPSINPAWLPQENKVSQLRA